MDAIVDQILAARKYRDLPPDCVRRLATTFQARGLSPKQVVKETKTRLHQVFGLYLDPAIGRKLDERMEGFEALSAGERRMRCGTLIDLHVSTAERRPHLAEFFAAIVAAAGPPRTLLDVACGLNPFALPWMGFSSLVEYRACEIDRRIVAAVNRLFAVSGLPEACQWRDALADPPADAADLALVLKTLPCLERQERGAAARLLGALRARAVVVSYPARTVGGRDVGMAERYDADLRALAAATGFAVTPLDTPYEPAYLLTR